MECKVRDIKVHYEEFGSGRPFLGLHGYPGNWRMTAAGCEPDFQVRTGWRRIYPDFLDFGDIPVPDWMHGPDSLADVLSEFMDAVAPGEHFTIAGWSGGAYLARGVVQRRLRRVDGVLLGIPLIAHGLTDLPPKQIIHHDPEFISALQPGEEWLEDVFVAQSRAALDSFRANMLAYWTNPNPEIMAQADKPYLSDPDVLIEPCPAPTLMIMGRQDHGVGYKQAWSILDNFPRATFAVLDRAGHGVSFEQPTLYRALVSEWLDRVEEYAPQNATKTSKQPIEKSG